HDIHYGKGTNIGTTIKFESIEDAKVNPQWVGNDISCGLTSVRIGRVEDIELDFDKLDELSRELHKPIGNRKDNIDKFNNDLWEKIGRVSGGNHFLEIGEMDGYYWVTVHNGSLSLGQKVYKEFTELSNNKKMDSWTRTSIIDELKANNQQRYIQPILQLISELDKERSTGVLDGEELKDYLSAIAQCDAYAFKNRQLVIQRVLEVIFDIKVTHVLKKEGDNLNLYNTFFSEEYLEKSLPLMNSPHNYIKLGADKSVTVFKGACSAEEGEDVLIPINMRDGIIVGKGLGNSGWNEAAPHGAGRLMSRTKAKKNIELDTYLTQLKGVRGISINENTLDEAPDAYKSMDYILDRIKDTVEVTGIIKPVYNFKVAEEEPHWMRKKKAKEKN